MVLIPFLLLIIILFTATTNTNTRVQAAGTETLIGVVGRDFVMLGADTSVSRSIVLTSTEVDKIRPLNDRTVLVASGELADVDDIYTNLKRHAALSQLETNIPGSAALHSSSNNNGIEFVNLSSSDHDKTNANVQIPEPWTVLSVSALAKLARHEIAQRLRSRAPYQGLGLLVAGMQQEAGTTAGGGSAATKIRWKSGTTTTSSQFTDDVRRQLHHQSQTGEAVKEEEEDDHKNDGGGDNNKNQQSKSLQPCLFWLDEYGSLQKINYGIHGLGANFGLAVLDQGYRDNLTRQEAADLIQNCFNQLQTRYLINSPKPPIIKCIDAKNGCYLYHP